MWPLCPGVCETMFGRTTQTDLTFPRTPATKSSLNLHPIRVGVTNPMS
jgi:hypothetical protein